jgi:transposase
MKASFAGGILGRSSKINDGMQSAVKLLREKDLGIKQIAKQLQIGVGTVYSVI